MLFQNPIVPVDAPQLHVAVGRQHLEVRGRVADNRDVERSSAQIVNKRLMRPLEAVLRGPQFAAVPGIGQRGGRWLVDDVYHVQPRDLAGVLRRLAA